VTLPTDARATVERARAHLGAGRTTPLVEGHLKTNVSMDAETVLLRQFWHPARDELEQTARWIRSQQRTDGTWATFNGGPGDLS